MVRLVHAGDTIIKLVTLEAALPQLTQPRQPARNQPETAARTQHRAALHTPSPIPHTCPIVRSIGRGLVHHLPIDVIGGAIEIDDRARGMRHQQRGAGFGSNPHCHEIDIAILEPGRRKCRVAHPFEQAMRVGPPRMRHRDHHRDWRRIEIAQGKRRKIGLSGNMTAIDQLRIILIGWQLLHGNKAAHEMPPCQSRSHIE